MAINIDHSALSSATELQPHPGLTADLQKIAGTEAKRALAPVLLAGLLNSAEDLLPPDLLERQLRLLARRLLSPDFQP